MSDKSTALSVFGGGKANLPAHIRKDLDNNQNSAWSNVGGTAVPRIEVGDRRIKCVLAGAVVAESKKPVEVVLMKPGAVGRVFYAKEFKKGETARPDCYSLDGKKPASDAVSPQCGNCDQCPMNVKGSSKTMADAKACRYRQPIALWVPGEKTWDTVFRLSLPATAIFPDEENSEGFMPLNKYVRTLRAAGVDPSTARTLIAIDDDQDQPRILFKPLGYIEDELEYEQVKDLLESPQMDEVLIIKEDAVPAGDSAHGGAPAGVGGVPGKGDEVDDIDTYWRHEATGDVFLIPAGRALPHDEDDCTELTKKQYEAALAKQAELEAKRAAAKQRAAEDDEPAPTRRRRPRPSDDEDDEPQQPARRSRQAPVEDDEPAPARRRTPVEPEPEDEPAPARRRREPEPEDEPAPARRRRDPEPEDEPAPARRRAAPVEDDDTVDEPTSRRRRAASAATEEAEDVDVAPTRRRRGAAAAPAEEPEDEPAPAPARRRRGAAAEEPAEEPATRRRRAAPAEEPEDEPATRRRRAAPVEDDAAAEPRARSKVSAAAAAALEDAIAQESDED